MNWKIAAGEFWRLIAPYPLRLRLAQALGRVIFFSSGYSNWQQAVAASSGYDAAEILERVLAATMQVRRGEAAYERDSVVFFETEVHWPTLAVLFMVAAHSDGRLNVLDFGGSLGSGYFQHKSFLRGISSVRWNVVEQKHFAEAGQAHVAESTLGFYDSIEACLTEQAPNVVLMSGVLQFLECPDQLLEQLENSNAKFLFIARTPVSVDAENRVLVQHVPASICKSSYPMWSFSERWLMEQLAPSWRFLTGSLSADGVVHPRGGGEISFKDMLFVRNQS